MKINIKKLNENAIIPTYGSQFSAGADLYALTEDIVTIIPGETKLIKTGISMEIPTGYAGLIYARSGLATKKGLAPANKVGVVDRDFVGEVKVALHNHSNEPQIINPMERIAQLVVMPYLAVEFNEVDELSETERGDRGFGDSGRF